ncbi:ubiquinone biosynthesis accessory factor UbiJ [Lysobacter hankyongensis]|uniref:Ubiquinone biosynthesis accessory factor UbiJ n=1 Tax=Lysobacter hankyongensis TaxID=1176535 RepID=A0ABP9AYR6_9GAMM
MTSPLDWKPLAGRALETALNRAIALDPDTRDALQALDGRSVVLALTAASASGEPPLALRLTVDGARLRVGPVDPERTPDLAVRGTLGGVLSFGMRTVLPRLLGAQADDEAMPVGAMRIEGDAELARRLQRLAERFDPDWQQPFAAVFGDVLGVQIANGVAAALRQARDGGRRFAETAAEYVTEESRDVVPRAELDAFHDDVDTLRDDAERLKARVARLARRIAA